LRRGALKLLWDTQLAGRAVALFLNDVTIEGYQNDLMIRSAVERQLNIVGEALSQLSRWDESLANSFQR